MVGQQQQGEMAQAVCGGLEEAVKDSGCWGDLREAEGDCVSVWGDICVGAVGTRRMAERLTGEGGALSQMNMLDCCLQDLAIWAPLS